MRNEVWADISGIGKLIIEEYLVVGNEPVLFTCRIENGNIRYLVMMYDNEDFEYVISPIYPSDLACMLNNEITMEMAFRKYGKIYFTHGDCNHICVKEYNSEDFSADYLPTKGEYFELKLNYIDRYINLLNMESCDVIDYKFDHTLLKQCLNYYSFLEKHYASLFFNFVESFNENIINSDYLADKKTQENNVAEDINSHAA